MKESKPHAASLPSHRRSPVPAAGRRNARACPCTHAGVDQFHPERSWRDAGSVVFVPDREPVVSRQPDSRTQPQRIPAAAARAARVGVGGAGPGVDQQRARCSEHADLARGPRGTRAGSAVPYAARIGRVADRGTGLFQARVGCNAGGRIARLLPAAVRIVPHAVSRGRQAVRNGDARSCRGGPGRPEQRHGRRIPVDRAAGAQERRRRGPGRSLEIAARRPGRPHLDARRRSGAGCGIGDLDPEWGFATPRPARVRAPAHSRRWARAARRERSPRAHLSTTRAAHRSRLADAPGRGAARSAGGRATGDVAQRRPARSRCWRHAADARRFRPRRKGADLAAHSIERRGASPDQVDGHKRRSGASKRTRGRGTAGER